MKMLPLLLLCPILFACSTTGVDRAESTVESIRASQNALAGVPSRIDSVNVAMEALARGGGDMTAQYASFATEVDALVGQRDSARKLSQEMQESRTAYIEAWEASIQGIASEDLRKKAVERREAVVREFGRLTDQLTEVQGKLDPWVQSVVDVRAYLENDLNPGGVESVSKNIRNLVGDSESIKKQLAKVTSDFEELVERIGATKPPPPAE